MRYAIVTALILAAVIFGYGHYRKGTMTQPPPPGATTPGANGIANQGKASAGAATIATATVQTQAQPQPKFGIVMIAVSAAGKKPTVTEVDPAGFDSMFSPVSNVPIVYDKFVNGHLWERIGPGGKVLWSKGPYPDNITSLGFTVEPGHVDARTWSFAYYFSPNGTIPKDWFRQARQHGAG